jgi:signal peptidase II
MNEMVSNKTDRKSFFGILKKHGVKYLVLFFFSALLIGLDQWTKFLVRQNIPLGSDWLPEGMAWLLPFARVRHWTNSGAAFGFFKNGNLIFTIVAIIVIILILYYFPKAGKKDWELRIAMILQFAGASGNLVDRLQFGHVTDFISVGNFAIFNVADASITVGVAVLLLGIWIREHNEQKKAKLAAENAKESTNNDLTG